MNTQTLIASSSHSHDTDAKWGYFMTFIGAMALVGWQADISLFRSWFPGLPEMRLHNAVVLLIFGFSLVNKLHLTNSQVFNYFTILLLFINGCVGLLDPLLPPGIPFSLNGIQNDALTAGIEDGAFIFSSSGFNFILLSFVMLFNSQKPYGWRVAGQLTNSLIIVISGLTILGYLFQDPGLYIMTLSHGMSLPTSVCLLIIALLAALNEPQMGLGRLFTTDNIGNALARKVFPATVGTVVFLATIFIFATQRDWFEPQSTMTILVSIFILSCLLVTWHIVKITNVVDYKRQVAKEELRELNVNLEMEIKSRTHELSVLTQRLDLATKGADISIWELDLESDSIKGNEVFYDLVGKAHNTESIHISEIIQLVHPEDLEYTNNELNKTIHEGKSLDLTHRMIKQSGEVRFLRLKGFTQRNEDGKAIKIYGAHWDVSDQKNIEERLVNQSHALETLSNRLTIATKGAKIGVWDLDFETQKIVWNDQMFKIYDIDPSEFSGTYTDWAGRVHPEDLAKLDAIGDVINKGEDFVSEFRIYHKDGSLHSIKSNGFMQKGLDGSLVRMVGTNIDITEQILAQKALQESFELNKRFVEQAPSAIAMFDREMNYLAASLQWKQDYHLNGTEIIGQSHYTIFPEISKEWKLLHQQCLQGAVIKEDEEAFQRANGTTQWLSWEIRPWYNHENAVGGIIMYTADVSARREQQQTVQQTKDDLEKLSIRLLHQNKLLADFAHITSHNLRAPVGNLNNLHGLYLEAESIEEKELIYSNFSVVVENLTTTLQELVTALTIKEDGDRQLETVELNKVLEIVSAKFSKQLTDNAAVVKSDFSQVKSINFNRLYLENIFENLLSNSLKFRSPTRTPSINVWARQENGCVMVYFEDNGIGIDMEKHGHKLFGLHKTFHRHSDSHGVGLFLTKTQVEALGGEIWAKSTVDKGTLFIIKVKTIT